MEAKFLTIEDIPQILSLQKQIIDALPDKATLQPLSVEEFTSILIEKELMIGLYDQDQLIACRAMLIPKVGHEDHLGPDANLTGEELNQVIHSEISMVHPNYRGQGLQTKMGKMLFANIDRSRFRYIMATVAPFNIPSLKDKLTLGMHIIDLKEKYRGKLRYILFKDLEAESLTMPSQQNEGIWIPMAETERQQQLFASGKKGIAIKQIDEEWHVKFVD